MQLDSHLHPDLGFVWNMFYLEHVCFGIPFEFLSGEQLSHWGCPPGMREGGMFSNLERSFLQCFSLQPVHHLPSSKKVGLCKAQQWSLALELSQVSNSGCKIVSLSFACSIRDFKALQQSLRYHRWTLSVGILQSVVAPKED